jgi:hypothetical protein
MRKFCVSIPVLILAVSMTIVYSCQKKGLAFDQVRSDSNTEPRKEYTNIASSHTNMPEKGYAGTCLAENNDGALIAVGFTISKGSLKSLPNLASNYVLNFPHDDRNNFNTQILIAWNPNVNESDITKVIGRNGVYFYIIPFEDRHATGPNELEEFESGSKVKYISPVNYLLPGSIAPIGAQWTDILSSVMYGSFDTKTFGWGAHDGSYIYWVPVFTLDNLKAEQDMQLPVKQPEAYRLNGYYANRNSIIYSEKTDEFTIAQDKLTYRIGE